MATESSVMAIIKASRPSFRNDHDKVAFAVHAAFLAAGYDLTATGRAAFADSPSTDEEVGIEGWNEFEDSYGFVYVKTEKGTKKKVIMKCLVIEDILAIDAVDIGDDNAKEPFNLQIKVKDYLSNDSSATGNFGGMYKNFGALVDSITSGILAKLEPPPSGSSSNAGGERSAQRPDAPAVGVPVEPQPYAPRLVYPSIPPSVFNDIDPGPGAGVFPDRGRFGGDGGMLIGPNDPRFFGGIGDVPGLPGGGMGGIPGVPPGARFDPYGPPGVPGFEPGRFVRQPRQPGGGTHPDLEHFQGPNYF